MSGHVLLSDSRSKYILYTPSHFLTRGFSFCDKMKYSTSEIVLGLLYDEKAAIKRCRTFLNYLVGTTVRRVLTLGPEEYRIEKSIKSITTVNNVWIRIMAEADRLILAERRELEPDRSKKDALRLIHPTCIWSSPTRTWPMKKAS